MANQQLIDYINLALSKGFSLTQIKQKLVSTGWSGYDVDMAISQVHAPMPQIPIYRPATETQQPSVEADTEKEGMSTAKILLIVILILIVGPIAIGILALIVLVALGMLAVGTQGSGETQTTTNVGGGELTVQTTILKPGETYIADCGKDMLCFRTHTINCSPATLIYAASTDVLGINLTQSFYLELKGMKEDKCEIYTRVDNVDLKFGEGTAAKEKQEITSYWETVPNSDATCLEYTKNLTDVFFEWGNGNYSATYYSKGCDGTLGNKTVTALGQTVGYMLQAAFNEGTLEIS